jgi:hypothetical protein
MASHLEFAVHSFDHRDALGDLEMRVLDRLDPPLNNDNARAVTPARAALAELRGAVTRGTAGVAAL